MVKKLLKINKLGENIFRKMATLAGFFWLLLQSKIVLAAGEPSAEFSVSNEFKGAISQIYNVAIGIIIIMAVLMIIVGGYTLVFSAGRPELATKGKKQISGAIIGLVIAILSAVFLNFINPAIFN